MPQRQGSLLLAGSPSPGMTANHHLVLSRERASADSRRPRGLRSADSAHRTRLLPLPSTVSPYASVGVGLCGQGWENPECILWLCVSARLFAPHTSQTSRSHRSGVPAPDLSESLLPFSCRFLGRERGRGSWQGARWGLIVFPKTLIIFAIHSRLSLVVF